MSALPRTTMASRLQVPREWDGLTGRTEAERREIQDRIERVSRLKARVQGRVLTPFEIALALGVDRRAPRRRCPACACSLPGTLEYFPTDGKGGLRGKCRPCWARCQARWNRQHTRTPGQKVSQAERMRRYRERRKAAGIPRPPETVLSRLKACRRHARLTLAKTTDPGRAERLKARIANLTHEINRLAEIGGGS